MRASGRSHLTPNHQQDPAVRPAVRISEKGSERDAKVWRGPGRRRIRSSSEGRDEARSPLYQAIAESRQGRELDKSINKTMLWHRSEPGLGETWWLAWDKVGTKRWVTGGRVGNIAAERQTQHKQQHGPMGAVRHPAPDELSVIPVCAKACTLDPLASRYNVRGAQLVDHII